MAAAAIVLHVEILREGAAHVSRCRELDIATAGESVEEAIRRTHDMVAGYFAVCVRQGRLADVLRGLGGGDAGETGVCYTLDLHIRDEGRIALAG